MYVKVSKPIEHEQSLHFVYFRKLKFFPDFQNDLKSDKEMNLKIYRLKKINILNHNNFIQKFRLFEIDNA